jgi:hypothetical protein
MSKRALWLILFLCGSGMLAGCGSSTVVPDVPPPPENKEVPAGFRLDAPAEVSLSALLAKPRAELAALGEECLSKIRFKESTHREGRLPFHLLPQARVPLVVPVWRQAKFSADRGFSVPPYLSPGKDTVLALHLARYGDMEAARKLVDTKDDLSGSLKTLALQRNYPVEWTRLVGLLLHDAEVGVATGELESAHLLVALHQQLLTVLDARARKSPLGAALLSQGRSILTQAAAAWRAEKNEELAKQAEAVLAAWGEVPALEFPASPGLSKADAVRLLGDAAKGKALQTSSLLRAFDVLRLPFPDEGAEGVVATFDGSDRLVDVLVTYRGRLAESYPHANQLATRLEERQSGKEAAVGGGLNQRSYRFGELLWDVAIVPKNHALGAFARLRSVTPSKEVPPVNRDFGAVHFDRGFEQNRVRFALAQRGPLLTVAEPKGLTNPVPSLKAKEAILQQQSGYDLVAELKFQFTTGTNNLPPLHQVALPLWAQSGSAQMEGVDDAKGGHLALIWEDAQTRATLRLPHTPEGSIELEVRDRSTSAELPQRATRIAARDRTDRQKRFESGKLLARLPRGLEGIKLGMTRDEVLAVVPRGPKILKRDLPDGFVLTNPADPPLQATCFARELFLRFAGNKRLAELRIHYTDVPGKGGLNKLQSALKKQGGAPESLPSTWASIWTDLPAQKPAPILSRWQDDATQVTCQRDLVGMEVVLRDCPVDHETGLPLQPLTCLPRGVGDCLLGKTRTELLQKWNIKEPQVVNGALVLPPQAAESLDALLIWFEKEKAVRIVARHTPDATQPAGKLKQAVGKAWGLEARRFGWFWRQDLSPQNLVQSWGTHDEATRVRIFWEETSDGTPRLYTEWKHLERP